MLTLKFLKNEIIKMIHSKKVYILLLFVTFMVAAICYMIYVEKINIMNDVPKTRQYSRQIRMDILNMNSVIFLKQFSTEFIFRTVVPYFVFFVVVFSVGIFGEDFFSGNMKYFARLDESHNNIFRAKILCLVVYSVFIVFVNIFIGFIISSIIFKISFQGICRILLIYLSAVIPVTSFGLIIGILSMFIKNKNISITIGIAAAIFLTVSDRLTVTSSFSPIGVLGLMEKVRADNICLSSLLRSNATSIIYLAAGYFIGKRVFEKREF
ncbi:hypothetical protein ACYUJ6_07625 [Clostridium sp. JNZ X4-2]